MKRTGVVLTATALTLAGAGVASAKPGNGNGAVKSGLAAASGLAPVVCSPASADAGKRTANGFVVLNAPGKPSKDGRTDSTRKLVGEVALKHAEPGTYSVYLVRDSSRGCGSAVASLTVNEQGNGNASFDQVGNSAGIWHVVLTTPLLDPAVPAGLQTYASAPVTLR